MYLIFLPLSVLRHCVWWGGYIAVSAAPGCTDSSLRLSIVWAQSTHHQNLATTPWCHCIIEMHPSDNYISPSSHPDLYHT